MVAVIKVSASIKRLLNYNENKVNQKEAACLGGANFPGEVNRLSFTAKHNYFARRMELNPNVSRNSLHISLNFDTSEKYLDNDKMAVIAHAYMQEIGFGEQPFIVYRHFDAGHPHLHLVTTNICKDGSRIDTHLLAIRKSEPARKKLEKDFALVRAQGHKSKPQESTLPRIVEYGKKESRAAIRNVLESVLDKYKYTSLAELNAVLGIYNIRADSGTEGSRISHHRGLLYRILSSDGQPVGVPIKASSFHSNPTLARLDVKFAKNKITAGQYKPRIRNAIDRLIEGSETGFHDAVNQLAAQGITVVKRQSDDGRIYGLTYIEHQSGAVFNGSALGKAYSAKNMMTRFPHIANGKGTAKEEQSKTQENLKVLAVSVGINDSQAGALIDQIASLLRTLTATELTAEYVPKQFSRKKRRKNRGQ